MRYLNKATPHSDASKICGMRDSKYIYCVINGITGSRPILNLAREPHLATSV